MSSRRLAESVEGLNSSLRSSGWRFIAKKGPANHGC